MQILRAICTALQRSSPTQQAMQRNPASQPAHSTRTWFQSHRSGFTLWRGSLRKPRPCLAGKYFEDPSVLVVAESHVFFATHSPPPCTIAKNAQDSRRLQQSPGHLKVNDPLVGCRGGLRGLEVVAAVTQGHNAELTQGRQPLNRGMRTQACRPNSGQAGTPLARTGWLPVQIRKPSAQQPLQRKPEKTSAWYCTQSQLRSRAFNMASARSHAADDDVALRSDDVELVRAKFDSGAADWALFGYTAPDDPRSRLRLLRTGHSSRDGPVQANLDPEAITFGIFKTPAAEVVPGVGEQSSGISGIESKDAGDVAGSAASDVPIVSFGFFGTRACILARVSAEDMRVPQVRPRPFPRERSGCLIASCTKHSSPSTHTSTVLMGECFSKCCFLSDALVRGATWSCVSRQSSILARFGRG